MADTGAYIRRLEESKPLREPVFRSIIQALELPSGTHGLDVGCGIGLQALLLADAVGPAGYATGLDISPEFLRYAEEIVKKSGLAGRISFREGDMYRLPFDGNSFDWAWSADCVGYPAGELLPALKEIVRVVKPGGRVAILAWSSQQLLSGYPVLEAWLNAACSAYAPFFAGKRPESHFNRALGWFREAGLDEPVAQTFVGDVQAPLSNDLRIALASLFEMLWDEPQSAVSSGEWSEYQRLCRPESPDFILNLLDYYAFFTYTMFKGIVAS
jgi:demethylmenaquinone methyltransferase/2-methoxy-6-polyprenyl-1,4-benzoquinol methylase